MVRYGDMLINTVDERVAVDKWLQKSTNSAVDDDFLPTLQHH